MTFKVFAFDAYGTLFDVHAAVRRHADAVGKDAAKLSDLWRAKQLEYTWVRTLMGAHRDFWALTSEALDFALQRFPPSQPAVRGALLDAYHALDAYPEVPSVLKTLKDDGARLAILSNGSRDMLAAAVGSAGIGELVDAVLSIDEIGIYKTDRRVYDLVGRHFAVDPADISFQSSNRWDIAGATRFGFRTVWVNRTGQPDEYLDLPPTAVVETLSGLGDLA